jgi:predicted GH43/DUF377 family glycosyl hydrolase
MSVKWLAGLAVVMLWVGFAAAQTDWVLYEGNPVIPGPEADEWPGLWRWVEAVVVVDGTYHMFFTGTSVEFGVEHEIGHATSPDGFRWTMDARNPIMRPETEGDWEVASYLCLTVIHDGSQFLMWYGGTDPAGFSQIGLATSPNGSIWTRHSENPVFETGQVGSFEYGVVIPGSVFRSGGQYHMWYAANEAPTVFSRGTIGYATSEDGVSWDRHSSPVLEPGSSSDWDGYVVYKPSVIFDGDSYHIWYTGLWGFGRVFVTAKIGYATSTDGILWTKDPSNPIDVIGEYAEQAWVLSHDTRRQLEMFYNTSDASGHCVNRATSTCQSYRLRTRRVSGMRVPVRGSHAAVPSEHR